MAKLPKTENRVSVQGIGRMGCIQLVRLALATGMRRGELAGLDRGSIDFDAGIVSVTKSLTRAGTTKVPKTKAGIRTIHVDKSTLEHLRVWKDEQASALKTIGVEQGPDTPVFCSDKGSYMDLPNLERFWRSFKKQHGFEGLRLHELRHTQATQLLARGVDVKTIQTRMGHASASVTLDWYSHPVEENDVKAVSIVGMMLSAG